MWALSTSPAGTRSTSPEWVNELVHVALHWGMESEAKTEMVVLQVFPEIQACLGLVLDPRGLNQSRFKE